MCAPYAYMELKQSAHSNHWFFCACSDVCNATVSRWIDVYKNYPRFAECHGCNCVDDAPHASCSSLSSPFSMGFSLEPRQPDGARCRPPSCRTAMRGQ